MFDSVVFLGTSAANPIPRVRNNSGIAVKLSSGDLILVDCGEATSQQLKLCSHTKISRIQLILITHLHGDHFYGLFGLICTMSMEGRVLPLEVVGPKGIQDCVETVLKYTTTGPLGYPLHFRELDGSYPPLFESRGVRIQALALVHSISCFGYVLQEAEWPGKLDVHKARSLGVPLGPLMAQLKQGLEVPGRDRVVRPQDVVFGQQPGRTLGILQDTCDSFMAEEAVTACELLIHEATFGDDKQEDAWLKSHSTARMAGRFAQKVGAHHLVLTHFSTRYAGSQNQGIQDLEKEAASEFEGQLTMAEDFLVLKSHGRQFVPLAQDGCEPPENGGKA